MIRDRQLFADLRALGVEVIYRDMPDDRDGEYLHDRRVIHLRRDMSARLHRSVLAHETAHAVFGDVPSRFGPVNAKQERRADEWAARRLIDREHYRHAETVHGGHAGAIAHELGVVRSIVDAYQRLLLRVEDTVYVKPGMGAGAWLHRERIAN